MFIAARKRCCLLIPDYLFQDYEQLRDEKGSLKLLLPVLISKFVKNRNRFFMKRQIDTTKGYQDDGLVLHREDFRPTEWDWASSRQAKNMKYFSPIGGVEVIG